MSYRYTPEDKRVLAWCNEIRAKLGKKPVRYIRKGEPEDGDECALAVTIGGVSLGFSVHLLTTDPRILDIPEHVDDWIADFDSGKLPHFIKGDTHA